MFRVVHRVLNFYGVSRGFTAALDFGVMGLGFWGPLFRFTVGY